MLFPLYFMLAVFLTVGYYALVHFNKAGIEGRKKLAANGYPNIYISKIASHSHATPLSLLMCSSMRVSPTYAQVVFSTWPFLLEYLLLTCLNKRLCGMWMYPFLEDAQRQGGRCRVFVVILLILVIGATCGLLGKWLIEARHYVLS